MQVTIIVNKSLTTALQQATRTRLAQLDEGSQITFDGRRVVVNANITDEQFEIFIDFLGAFRRIVNVSKTPSTFDVRLPFDPSMTEQLGIKRAVLRDEIYHALGSAVGTNNYQLLVTVFVPGVVAESQAEANEKVASLLKED